MSGWFVAFDPAGPAELPAEVAAELVRYPHETFAGVDHACGASAQALRRYTARDADVVLPFVQDDVVLVGDLRLDETAALAAELDLPAGATDPELVVAAYRRFGAKMLARHLLGDFAFALVDAATGMLVLVRDPMGIRPLYVARVGTAVLAASDIAILAAHPGVPRDRDDDVAAEWLLYGQVWNQDRTLLAAAGKVRRASVRVVSAAGERTTVYWTPPQGPAPDQEEYVRRVAELVVRATVDRSDATYPLGSHNSGGYDSGVISTLAGRHIAPARLTTFNWCRPTQGIEHDPSWDVARQMAAAEGFDHHEIGYSPEQAREAAENHDLVTEGTIMFEYERTVLPLAASLGVRQILSGHGGDEFLTGHEHERLINVVRNYGWRAAWAAHGRKPSTARGWRRVAQFTKQLTVVQRVGRARFDDYEWQRLRKVAGVAEAARLGVPVSAAVQAQAEGGVVAIMAGKTLRSTMEARLNSGHLPERAEAWSALGRRHGARYTYPMLDVRVVELALRWSFGPEQMPPRSLYLEAATSEADPASLAPKSLDVVRVDELVRAQAVTQELPDFARDLGEMVLLQSARDASLFARWTKT